MYEIFCESLREHAKNIVDFEKKLMLPPAKEELKSHQDAKVYHICRKRFLKKFANDKNYRKVRDHCHYTGKHIVVFVVQHLMCPMKSL